MMKASTAFFFFCGGAKNLIIIDDISLKIIKGLLSISAG